MSYKTKDLKVFGYVWSVVLLIAAYIFDANLYLCLLSAIFAVSALLCPHAYPRIGIYQGWITIGNALGWINGTIITFLLFFGIFAPMGIVRRLLGKDVLSKKFHAEKSYFIDRVDPPHSMKNQF